jgi:FKBP-type peptidyl-prolyl cis-trans isomerase (trigger factor)
VVRRHIGEMRLLEQAAGIVLDKYYGQIIEDLGIRAVGAPKITVTKLAQGNPLGFRATTAVFPEVVLKNYFDLAKEESEKITQEDFGASDEEVEKVLKDLEGMAEKSQPLPNKNKVRENIVEHKKNLAREKKRVALAERLIKAATIDIPDLIVESELDTMVNRLKADIENAGLTYEGYLNQTKKTNADLRTEWRKVAKEEKVVVDEEKIKKEMEHILSHHKDADRFRVRMYIENALLNESVFELLEGKK